MPAPCHPCRGRGSALGCTRAQRDWSMESFAELWQRSDCETTSSTLYLGCSKICVCHILTSFLEIQGQKGGKLAEFYAPGFLFKKNSAAISLMFDVLPNSTRQRPACSEIAKPGTCAIWCDSLTAVGIQGHMRLPFPLEHCNYLGHKGVCKEKKLTHYTYKLYSQVLRWLIKLLVHNSSSCGIIFHKWDTPTNRCVIEYISRKSNGDNSGN